MLRFILASSLIAGALDLFHTPAPAQDRKKESVHEPALEYRIQIERFVKGMRLRHVETAAVIDKMQVVNVKDGQSRTAWTRTPGRVNEWTDTVLEIPGPGKLPSRLRRHYTKARTRDNDGKEQTLPLEGRVVFIDMKDAKEVVQDEEGNALPKELAIHVQSGRNAPDVDAQWLPIKPVRLNESWKAEPRLYAGLFPKSYELDAKKATAVGKLAKVFTKDGRQYGVLEFRYSYVPIRFHMTDKLALPVLPGSKCTLDLTTEACIDGTLHDATNKGRIVVDVKMQYREQVEFWHDWTVTLTLANREIVEKK